MSANVLEGVLCHQPLQVLVLLKDVSGVEVVEVGALHAPCDEDLVPLVESPPLLDCERYSLVFVTVPVAYLLEAYLLYHLETVN